MKRILDIGHNDLRLFFKSKSAYIWLFAMPLAFVYFMGFANRGPGDPSNRRPPVLVENNDTNFLGRALLDELDTQGMWLLDPTNRESAARMIRIPEDFSRRVMAGEQSKVGFFKRDGSAKSDAMLIEVRLVRALIAMNSHLLEAAAQTDNAPESITEEQLREVMKKPNPVALDAKFAGRKPVPSGFAFSLPGNLVLYLLMNLMIFGGASVAAERRNGVIRRLMVHPVTNLELVMGKIYGLMLLGAVQIGFFLVVGKLVLGVNLGANVPAVTLTLLVLAWVGGSLGVLVGSVFASEDRVVGLCVLVSLLMGALGGCWWPLEIAPPTLQKIALFLPTGWALKGLHQLISFGSGFGPAVIPLIVLLVFGLSANLLAARFFRS
ncbi:MAG: ABC transporter permease [Verrucomicrobiae bacterium]|nr:ABC transporter permease [Verrucomicrobiae bacterium]